MAETYETPEPAEEAPELGGDRKALFERAKERINDYKDVMRDEHDRMREDLRFSNPSNPEQWSSTDKQARGSRPTLTLDRTNQFIMQVANDQRQNNAGIEVIPADGEAHPKAAETIEAMVRHIEYCSRAPIAYSTGGDLQVRCGRGWLRAFPEKCNGEMEIRIGRITDPTAAGIDLDCKEPDGQGAKWGFVEGQMHIKTFRKEYPNAAEVPMGEEGWRNGDFITIAEYFEIDEDGEQLWLKMTGAEIIEDPIPFPSQYLGLVPIVGNELEVDGKVQICGLTRRLMDGQRLHNFEMSAIAEFLASQPKAPIMATSESMQGLENYWKKLNSGNPAVLPYKAFDAKGQPLPMPQRMLPPPMPGAYAQMAQFATEEMQAAVGMYKANLGQQGNETAGVAIRARQMEGDVATLQFPTNLGYSIAQLGRVIVDMIPKVYTKARVQRIVGVDGDPSFVKLNPSLKKAVRLDAKGKVTAFNPGVGTYDVVVKSGPSFTTMREETVADLSEMIKQQPQLAPVLGPMWARLRNMPQGDKIAKLLLAMAPPQVQQIESEDEDIPPQVAAQMQSMKQQMEQMNQVMEQAAQKIHELETDAEGKRMEMLAKVADTRVKQYDSETKRIQVLGAGMTAEQVQAMIVQTLHQVFSNPAPGGDQPPDSMPMDAPEQPILPSGMDTNAPPGAPPAPDPAALPEYPLAHQAPEPSSEGSVVSEGPQ